MEINNFRINNLVYYNGKHNEIGKITKLVSDVNPELSRVGVNYRTDIHYLLKHIKGVPITEEHLIRFGFQERKESDNFSKWWIGENPVTHDWLFFIKQFKDENEFFFQNGYHIIEYLHELQNLCEPLIKQNLVYGK